MLSFSLSWIVPFHSPSSVEPGETGEAATELIDAVLEKEDLL